MTIFLILWAISTVCSLLLVYIFIRKDVYSIIDMIPATIFSFFPVIGLIIVLGTGLYYLNKTINLEQKIYDWIKS